MNSQYIKHKVMSYFRFKRQWLCATECLLGDVIALTGKDVIEVEVKISKQDLIGGEERKDKHIRFGNDEYHEKWYCPTKYGLAVPENLAEEAVKWIEKTNPKYGLIIIKEYGDPMFARTFKRLSDKYNKDWERVLMMRVCAENISLIQRLMKKKA